jgi:hypothetical protein
VTVTSEDGASRQGDAGSVRDANEAGQADDRRHGDDRALGAERGTVALHDLGLGLEHEHDGPASGDDAERLEGGIEQ